MKKFILTCAVLVFFAIVQTPPLLRAASPSLPFTEDFSAANLKDPVNTKANWSTDEQKVYLAWRRARYNAMSDPVTWNIGTIAGNTVSVAVGDVDGDGDLDIVEGIHSERNKLYLNNGSEAPFIAVAAQDIGDSQAFTNTIALGDMDGDGDLDVITRESAYAAIYLNNGTSLPFQNTTAISISAGNGLGVAIGDLNNDGHLDIVTGGNSSNTNKLFLNNGTLNPFVDDTSSDIDSVTTTTYDIALGDMDGDGDLDVVVGNRNGMDRLCLNNGDGTFAPGLDIGTVIYNTQALDIGDVDGDGDLDIVTGTTLGLGFNWVYQNNGTSNPFGGVVASSLNSDPDWTDSIILGDIDNDGDLDVIAGNQYGLNKLYLNNGSQTPFLNSPGLIFAVDELVTVALALGDMDGDGDLDLVTGEKNGINKLYLNRATDNPFESLPGTGIGTFSGNSYYSDPLDEVTYDIAVADYNRDGFPDIMIANFGQDNVIYLNNGSDAPFDGVDGLFFGGGSLTYAIAVGDLNGDGRVDVVFGNASGEPDHYRLNGIDGYPIGDGVEDCRAIVLGDVNSDGHLDVIMGTGSGNKLFLNNGTAIPFDGVTATVISSDAPNTWAIALGDMDNDGDLDVVTGNFNETNRLYLNDGDGDPFDTSTPTVIGSETYLTTSIALGDLDGDGDLDIVEGNTTLSGSGEDATNRLYLNDGEGDPFDTTSAKPVGIDFNHTQAIAIGDVNSDGHLDVVAGNFNSEERNQIYLNNGTDDPFNGVIGLDAGTDRNFTRAVALADLDLDGKLDIVAGNGNSEGDNTNKLYLNLGTATPFGKLTESFIGTQTDDTESFAFGDVDNDGDLDVVTGNNGQTNKLYLNNGSADPFNNATVLSVGSETDNTIAIAMGDVNNDGRLDIVAGNDGQVDRVYLNDGDGNPFDTTTWELLSPYTIIIVDFTPQYIYSHETEALALGDVNGDGNLDIVTCNKTGDVMPFHEYRLHLNDGSGNPFDTESMVTQIALKGYNADFSTIVLGDINRDGLLDVVVADSNAHAVFINEGDFDPFDSHLEASYGSPTDETYAVALGDVNGDGLLDVVAGNYGQANQLRLNQGGDNPGFWFLTGTPIGADTDGTQALTLADVDRDGDLDVIAWNRGADDKLYLNNGTADPFNGVAAISIVSAANDPTAAIAADLNGNGSLDLAVANNGQTNALYRQFKFIGHQNKAVSLAVDLETINNISNATLSATQNLPVHTDIDYYLSNNGGQHFFQVYPDQEFIFPTQGHDLRWRAELKTLSPVLTPEIQEIRITNRNIAPQATAGGLLAYTEDDAATAIDPGITVNDIDNVNLTGAVITIASGTYQNGEDVLGFTNQNGISGSWNAGNGQLTLSGNASVANYQAALRSVTYHNTSQDPIETDRTIQLTVDDDINTSDPATSTITITRTNDPPIISDYYTAAGQNPSPIVMTQSDSLTFDIGEPPAPSGSVYLAVTDPDSTPEDFMLIVLAGDNYFLASRTITPMQEYSGTLTVPVMIYDGTDYSDLTYFNIQVNDVTDPTVSLVAVQVGGLTVDVTFSEPMGTGVTNVANYAISGNGKGTLTDHPDSVVYFVGNTYRLTWSAGEMLAGGDVTVSAVNVQDDAGRTIGSPDSGTDITGGIGVAPVTGIINGGGTYTSNVTVTLECTDSGSGCAQTYYSLGGGAPSSAYTDPIDIAQDTVLKYYSLDQAGNQEAVQTEIYSIEIPTTITCILTDPDPLAAPLTYGRGFTISGSIDPPPNNPNQGVSIELIQQPGGPTVFLSTNADVNGDFELEVECDSITGPGGWKAQASWPGDESHLGDIWLSDAFTVLQANADLTLDIVMAEAVKVNSRPPIGGSFSPMPHCTTMDLSNTIITLIATEPDGETQHVLSAYANQYGQFLLDYQYAEGGGEFAFDVLGEWTIAAEYAATTNFAGALTDEVTIRVIPTAGYAIVVQGRVASGEGMPSHHKTATFVYEKLKDRQLLDDDIQYLSWLYHDGWDGDPSRTNMQHAITEWARDKMDPTYHPATGPDYDGKPGDLYIILVDHGWTDPQDDEEGMFFIYPEAPLTSTELAGWLDDLQDSLTGEAANRNIVVILGFCRAGAFMDQLAGDNRVVIASAAKNEASHRGPQDVDAQGQPLRDGEYFVSEFFKSVSFGQSIKDSFEQATALTEAFTSTGSGVTNAPYYDDSVQHPLLNDNGDAVGSNELSIDEGEDGSASAVLFIGASPPEGNDPGDVLVTKVAEAQFLDAGTGGAVDLWAEVDSPVDVRLIWLEVKEPNYDPVDPGAGLQIEMETFKKATTDVTGVRYLWNAVGNAPDPTDLFDTPGTYQVFYFVKDNQTGHTSPLMQGRVYRDKAGNLPPASFDLLSPADCSDPGCIEEYATTIALDWEDALNQEPETDVITYTVLLSKDDPLFTDPIRVEGLPYSACILGPEHGIEDDSTYYWKVLAIDQFGADTKSTSTWVFKTDNTNALGFGWIEGHVYSAYDDTPIPGATVAINGVNIITGTGGYYLGILTPGTYAAEISAEGFTLRTVPGVAIPELGLTTREFWLAPDAQVPDPVFDQNSGTYTNVIAVLLSSANPSAEIRYTLDGSVPNEGSMLYAGPIEVTQTVTIKAKSFLFGFTPSNTVVRSYTIDMADGDLSGEGEVNIADAIAVLQIIAGMEPTSSYYLSADVNNDAKIGMQEFIFILQKVAGLR